MHIHHSFKVLCITSQVQTRHPNDFLPEEFDAVNTVWIARFASTDMVWILWSTRRPLHGRSRHRTGGCSWPFHHWLFRFIDILFGFGFNSHFWGYTLGLRFGLWLWTAFCFGFATGFDSPVLGGGVCLGSSSLSASTASNTMAMVLWRPLNTRLENFKRSIM